MSVFNPAGSEVLERPAGALRAGLIVTVDLRANNYVTLCLHPCEYLSTDSRSARISKISHDVSFFERKKSDGSKNPLSFVGRGELWFWVGFRKRHLQAKCNVCVCVCVCVCAYKICVFLPFNRPNWTLVYKGHAPFMKIVQITLCRILITVNSENKSKIVKYFPFSE